MKVTDARRRERMIEIQNPVHDIDPVHHQVGEDATAKIPEPARQIAKAIFIESLRRRTA